MIWGRWEVNNAHNKIEITLTRNVRKYAVSAKSSDPGMAVSHAHSKAPQVSEQGPGFPSTFKKEQSSCIVAYLKYIYT